MVALVGVEALQVPFADCVHESLLGDRLVGPDPLKAPPHVEWIPRSRIGGQRDDHGGTEHRGEEPDEELHGSDSLLLGGAQRRHDVKGDGLVFDLLDEVPREKRLDLFVVERLQVRLREALLE